MITIRNNSICYDGLSTDEKPSKVYNGSIFNEIDTGKRFIFDEINSRWLSYDKQTTPSVESVNGKTGVVNLKASDVEALSDDTKTIIQDLGVIDGDAYDWDLETYLNTLRESGSYVFLWDEFKYFVDIKSLEVDGTTTVQQIFWGTEEGPGNTAYRNLVIESGEILSADTVTYLTFQEASSAFARNTHVHVRFATQAQSIWDYCNTVALQNANPIVIYFDSSTNKTYLIETYVGNRQPVYKMQKVTEMNDISYFCQRSSYYYSGAEHWGDWYKFAGEVYTPGQIK